MMRELTCLIPVQGVSTRFNTIKGHLCTLLVSATLVVSTNSAFAQTLPAYSAADVSRALASNQDISNELYAAAIMETGALEDAINIVSEVANDTANNAALRAKAHYLAAKLYWRHGQPGHALEVIEKALLLNSKSADIQLLKAKLLDAKGESVLANQAYTLALTLNRDNNSIHKSADVGSNVGSVMNADMVVRHELLKLIHLDKRSRKQRDETLASQLSDEVKAGFAVAKAILGFQKEAIRDYQGQVKDDFVSHIRLAEWAVQAKDFPLAQTVAMSAYDAANLENERRYAQAVLVDAYRLSNELNKLVKVLNQKTQSAQMDELIMSLLMETGQYQEAINKLQAVVTKDVYPNVAEKLIRLYTLLGKQSDVVAQYEKLIRRHPDYVPSYSALSSFYLNKGDAQKAREIWHKFQQANNNDVSNLLMGAEAMIQMGFFDEAIAMMEQFTDDKNASLFLFEVHLNNGNKQIALQIVDKLVADVETLSDRLEIVDLYEQVDEPLRALNLYLVLEQEGHSLNFDHLTRKAWLLTKVGRDVEAMHAWIDIWKTEKSAARRSLAKNNLLLLEGKIKAERPVWEKNIQTLGDLTTSIANKIEVGNATQAELDLLVQISVEAGDVKKAQQIINRYSKKKGLTEIERLSLLSKAYLMAPDYVAYTDTLRTLYKIDVENRAEHIQSILLSILNYDVVEDEDKPAEVRLWLDRIKALGDSAVDDDFRASILVQAGMMQEAILAYQRALITHPKTHENVLLLAQAQKAAGQIESAIAMLQYKAEHSASDEEFIIAIDSLINMTSAGLITDTLSEQALKTNAWAERVVLERIIKSPNKYYLYSVFADLAQASKHQRLQVSALHASLAVAGPRLPIVLRELVTLTSSNAGFGSFSTGAGNAEQKIAFGRRLLATQKLLPPELFIDLARTHLSMGDRHGAEVALSRVRDLTGTIALDKTRAEVFEAAGYLQEATDYYGKALSVNRQDYELIIRYAILAEASGDDESANNWYLVALKSLLLEQVDYVEQAIEPPTATLTSASRSAILSDNYRKYYEPAMQGLIITQSGDKTKSREQIASVLVLLEEELKRVEALANSKGIKAFFNFPRLVYLAQFIRRYAFSHNLESLALDTDLKLSKSFEGNSFHSFIVKTYRTNRQISLLSQIEKSLGASPQVRDGLKPISQFDDIDVRFRQAYLSGDSKGSEDILVSELKSGNARVALLYAKEYMVSASFISVIEAHISDIVNNDELMFELVSKNISFVFELETILGRPLLTPSQKERLIESEVATTYAQSTRVGVVPDMLWPYIQRHATSAEQLEYFTDVITTELSKIRKGGGGGSAAVTSMARGILAQPLSIKQQQLFYEQMVRYLDVQDYKNDEVTAFSFDNIFIFDAAPQNADLIYRVAEYWQKKTNIKVGLKKILRNFYDGKPEQGVKLLFELMGHRLFKLFKESYLSSRLISSLSIELSILVNKFIQGGPLSKSSAVFLFDKEFGFMLGSVESVSYDNIHIMQAYIQQLTQRFDGMERFERLNIALHMLVGNREQAIGALNDYVSRNPDDPYAEASLYCANINDQQYTNALELVKQSRFSWDDDLYLAELKNAVVVNATAASDPYSNLNLIKRFCLDKTSALTVANGINRDTRVLAALKRLKSQIKDDSQHSKHALRLLWREVLGTEMPKQSFHISRLERTAQGVLNLRSTESDLPYPLWFLSPSNADYESTLSISDVLKATKAREASNLVTVALNKSNQGGLDLERFLMAMPAGERDKFAQLNHFSAEAYIKTKQADSRLTALNKQFRAGQLPSANFALWMQLRLSSAQNLSVDEIAILKHSLTASAGGNSHEYFLAAQLFGRAGDVKLSEKYFQRLMVLHIDHGEFNFFRRLRGPRVASLLEILTAAEKVLPMPIVKQLALDTLTLAKQAGSVLSAKRIYDAFVLRTLERYFSPDEVISKAQAYSNTALSLNEEFSHWQGAQIVEATRAYAKAGRFAPALQRLKSAVMKVPEQYRIREVGREISETDSYARTAAWVYGIKTPPSSPTKITFSPAAEVIMHRDRVFPNASSTNVWQGASTWSKTAAEEMLLWFNDDSLNHSVVINHLLLIVLERVESGDRATAIKTMKGIFDYLYKAGSDRLLPESLNNLVQVALELNIKVVPDDAKKLLSIANIASDLKVMLLRQIETGSTPQDFEIFLEKNIDIVEQGGILQSFLNTFSKDLNKQVVTYLNNRLKKVKSARDKLIELGLTG